jgi:subtilisin family serine protease
MRAPRMFLALLATFALVVGVMPTAHADGTVATYIVELKDGVSADATIPTLLGPDAKVLDKVMQAGIASLTASQAQALASNPYVKSVRLDKQVSSSVTNVAKAKTSAQVTASAIQTNVPWDLDILDSQSGDQDGNYTPLNGGNGVTVYVVDTGIYRANTQFAGVTVAAGYNFVTTENPVRPASDTSDCDGQGTAVASLIAGTTFGAAKGVTIVPLRVLDCTGGGWETDLLPALDYIVANHPAGTPAVVDIGLGIQGAVLADLDAAVQSVINAGITVVVAADFRDVDACLSSPGDVPNAITVAASASGNAQATGTSWGSCIDLYAPGQDVSIADIVTPTSTAIGSGTAYSAALVTGVAAQILHTNPAWTPAQVSAEISALATNGKITNAPALTPNKLLSLGPVYQPFVTASYTDFLGRLPVASELSFQSNALMTGTVTLSNYLTALAKSDEWLTAIVTKDYAVTLGRAPDPAGLAYWVGLLRSGTYTVAQVASLFFASDEYYLYHAGGTPTSWVTLLYQKLLNRNPDAAGLASWVSYTNNPKYGKSWVAYQFFQSQESRMLRVEGLYQALLHREPDATGWPFWAQSVLTTGDITLAINLASSQEYWEQAHLRY